MKMTDKKKKSKEDYAKTVEPGVIIAFEHIDEQGEKITISGKILARREDGFEVQTIRGTKLNVLFDNVLWYKTGRRWPKYIFNLLQGKDNDGERKEK